MLATGSGSNWEVRAPAKVNLRLDVLRRRGDGFHEVETLMVPVALYDTLKFEPDESGKIQLRCRSASVQHPGLGALGDGEDNLVCRAVNLLRERAGFAGGARITLEKRIPVGAGLGGGSSDAAAALVLANDAWNLGWSPARLGQIAGQIGSDVPFFLAGSAAVCRGRGEQVEPVALPRLHFVIASPSRGLSTAEVYGACQPDASISGCLALVRATQRGDWRQLGRLLHNRLQAAAETLSLKIARLRREFARHDFLGHQLTGSGSSYFGICRHAHHARIVAARLRARGIGHVVAAASC